jgi:hypothetical protein
MSRRLKLWIGMSSVALLAPAEAVLAQSPHAHHGPAAQAAVGKDQAAKAAPATKDSGSMAAQGGEGGEGGEGGVDQDAFAFSKPAEQYVGRLLLARGHVTVGLELYAGGDREAAAQHFAHPAAEIYDWLQGELVQRGAPEFKADLDRLVAAALRKAPLEEVRKLHAVVLTQMDAAEAKGEKLDEAAQVRVIGAALDQAAHEYNDSAKARRVVNLTEYQDARGFWLVTKAWFEARRESLQAKAPAAAARLAQDVDAIGSFVPAAKPPAKIQPPGTFQATASRIRFAAGEF